jgi:type IV secretion system protein VirD4
VRIYGSHEDTYLVYAGPRTGKTGWMSGVLKRAPGFGLSTSTRPDVWGHTSIPRSKRGPILTLDVDPFSGIGSSLAWDMLDGCAHPAIAIERAGYLMDAAPKNEGGKDAWWDHNSAEYLRLLLHAGELAGANLLDVRAWAGDPSSKEPVSVLYRSQFAAAGWAEELDELSGQPEESRQSIARGVVTALGWLSDPAMAAIACPSPERSLRAWDLINEGGTIYLIGANKPHGSIAAFNASLTSHLWETGKRIAGLCPGYRLDPPAMFVIDEPAITCPVPLDRWFAEAGGWGMPVVTGVQSPAQLIRQWGPEGARIIRDCATIEIVFGGNTDDKELESISAICGGQDSWKHTPGTGGRSRENDVVRLYPPERIRTLPDGHAVVLHRSARPVEARVHRVWDDPDYERADAMPVTPFSGPVWPDGTPVITAKAEDVLGPAQETLSIPEGNQ